MIKQREEALLVAQEEAELQQAVKLPPTQEPTPALQEGNIK